MSRIVGYRGNTQTTNRAPDTVGRVADTRTQQPGVRSFGSGGGSHSYPRSVVPKSTYPVIQCTVCGRGGIAFKKHQTKESNYYAWCPDCSWFACKSLDHEPTDQDVIEPPTTRRPPVAAEGEGQPVTMGEFNLLVARVKELEEFWRQSLAREASDQEQESQFGQ